MCREGVRVAPSLAGAIKQYENDIKEDEGLRKIFINPETNNAYQLNDTVKYESLAKTFEIISEKGADAFYKGELTEKLVNDNKLKGIFHYIFFVRF